MFRISEETLDALIGLYMVRAEPIKDNGRYRLENFIYYALMELKELRNTRTKLQYNSEELIMSEYIKREDAIKIAKRYGIANGSALGRYTGIADCIASEIAALPDTNAIPVVHGEWEQADNICGDEYARCTNCNDEFSITGGWTFEDYSYYMHFCPSCGAKMIRSDKSC